jgi:transcriptional regulator with XRE-family HTH domain
MIGDNIKKIMEIRNLKSKDICKAGNFKPAHFSKILNNKINPSNEVLVKLADVLICSTDELLGRG